MLSVWTQVPAHKAGHLPEAARSWMPALVFFFPSPPITVRVWPGGEVLSGRGGEPSGTAASGGLCASGRGRAPGEGSEESWAGAPSTRRSRCQEPSAQEEFPPLAAQCAQGRGRRPPLLPEQLHNHAWVLRAGRRLCYRNPPRRRQRPRINKPIPHGARRGFICVGVDWGTSRGVPARDTGLRSREGGREPGPKHRALLAPTQSPV